MGKSEKPANAQSNPLIPTISIDRWCPDAERLAEVLHGKKQEKGDARK